MVSDFICLVLIKLSVENYELKVKKYMKRMGGTVVGIIYPLLQITYDNF